MVGFNNIEAHEIERPNGFTCLGRPEEFDSLSDEFKAQIKFLDSKASEFLYNYLEVSGFHTGVMWKPFEEGNFKCVERIVVSEDEKRTKKWLYNRGIAFSKWVYVLPNYRNAPLTMTWKMVIKNCGVLFFADDVVIFDETNQWCLSYWHEDEMFFGKVNTLDPEVDGMKSRR